MGGEENYANEQVRVIYWTSAYFVRVCPPRVILRIIGGIKVWQEKGEKISFSLFLFKCVEDARRGLLWMRGSTTEGERRHDKQAYCYSTGDGRNSKQGIHFERYIYVDFFRSYWL